MFRGVVTRSLILMVWSLLFPPTVGAGDNGKIIQVAHVEENIRMFVRISDKDKDGRMSAVPFVVVSRSATATPGEEETPNGKHGGTFEAVWKGENAGTTGKTIAAVLLDEQKVVARIGGMVSGTEEISYSKVSGILRDIRETVKKNRRKPPVEENIVTVKEATFPGPLSMAR